jgi:hypothetical protein
LAGGHPDVGGEVGAVEVGEEIDGHAGMNRGAGQGAGNVDARVMIRV